MNRRALNKILMHYGYEISKISDKSTLENATITENNYEAERRERIKQAEAFFGTYDNPLDITDLKHLFPLDYDGGGPETKRCYLERIKSGFFERYFSGDIVLDIGFRGGDNPNNSTIVPHALGIDTDYPGYDGITLPFGDESVDCVSSSHCLEHIWFAQSAIRDWHRVLKVGGYIVCMVPHQFLYEKAVLAIDVQRRPCAHVHAR